jgi:hypothetical protein
MENHIKESMMIIKNTVMDSWSIKITMSMTVNGGRTKNTEKEFSRQHQLEELKEEFINMKELKKLLKS